MEVTETPTLRIIETDALEPPLSFPEEGRYAVGLDGEPIQLPRDTRMVTTRGFLKAIGAS